jgi:HSP90 family molecular chaperone
MSNKTPIAKPLSADDVLRIRKEIATLNQDKLHTIINTYCSHINSVITMVKEQLTDETEIAEMERLKRIIGFCPKEELFIRTKEKVWNVRDHIINKDMEFFYNRDYSSMVKKDENQSFIEALMNIVKYNFKQLTPKEQDRYWNRGIMMLKNIVEFEKLRRGE